MDKDYQITVDNLIKDELDGKANAIAQYDGMLWKIRSGYAVFLYASIGLITGLVNENIIDLSPKTAASLSVLFFLALAPSPLFSTIRLCEVSFAS